MNKYVLALILVISVSALLLPSLIAWHLYIETMEYKEEVVLLRKEMERTETEIRLIKQDVMIVENISTEKDFIKR